MTPTFDQVQKLLKKLPGLGHRSAERIALHLLVEKPATLAPLLEALHRASATIRRCAQCGHLCEAEQCDLCLDPRRDPSHLCVVEQVPDLLSIERAAAFRGLYHVLHGRLSPLNGVGPDELNLASLEARLAGGAVQEVTLALSNDIEGEATCHYLTENLLTPRGIRATRIGFGLPSGGGVTFADALTLRSALEGRREYR